MVVGLRAAQPVWYLCGLHMLRLLTGKTAVQI